MQKIHKSFRIFKKIMPSSIIVKWKGKLIKEQTYHYYERSSNQKGKHAPSLFQLKKTQHVKKCNTLNSNKTQFEKGILSGLKYFKHLRSQFQKINSPHKTINVLFSVPDFHTLCARLDLKVSSKLRGGRQGVGKNFGKPHLSTHHLWRRMGSQPG